MTATLTCNLPHTVVVTGATSGLGAAICRLLLECGVQTIGIDLGEAPATPAGAPYTHVKGDVTSQDMWTGVATRLKNLAPPSLGLITSAAILEVGSILALDKASLERTLSVNVVGTALAMKTVLPAMLERKRGVIVAIASVDATFAEQQLSAYAASKGAVRQLARTIAMDHARGGVRVNVLSPGPMKAGLFERHMKSANNPELFYATRAARQPGGDIISADDVGRVALFLLSDASSAMNGADVLADGGLTASFDFRTGAEGASI